MAESVGRPKTPDDEKLTEKYGPAFNKADAELIESLAEEAGIKPATWLRNVVLARLRRERSKRQ
ncbi:MAG: hypothetical protein AAGC72_05740 [Planctomycetota bacterium]